VSGGVAGAVEKMIHKEDPDREVKTARAEGLRECRKLMTLAKAGKYNGYLLEGMGCPGGCIAGAGTLLPVELAAKVVGRYQGEADISEPTDSAYRDLSKSLEEE
jgi:iron only hydrogenase large subunit-like protein